jgi:hypothetical protein
MNFAGLQARIVPLIAELFATLASRNPLRMYFADIAGKTVSPRRPSPRPSASR